MNIFLDEEDVHQCGRCKQLFNTLKLYMSHKASKVCKLSKTKVVTNIPDSSPSQSENQNILEAAANSTIFRDSFISMEPEGMSNKDSLIKDFEVENRDGAKEMKTLILKFDQQGKRSKGYKFILIYQFIFIYNYSGQYYVQQTCKTIICKLFDRE